MPKFKLSRPYVVEGKTYGPGEIEVKDPEVVKGLKLQGAHPLAERPEASKTQKGKKTATKPSDEKTGDDSAEGTPLPEDFPAKDELEAASLLTVEAVLGAEVRPETVSEGAWEAAIEYGRRLTVKE